MKQQTLVILLGLSISLFACNSDTQSTAEPTSIEGSTKQSLAKSEPLTGQQLFFVCQACHSLADGAEHKVGPNLYGIIDQPAASRDAYSYSEPLKNSGLIWNRGTLIGWILAAENVAPGTWMIHHNHLSIEEIQRLVDYIATQK